MKRAPAMLAMCSATASALLPAGADLGSAHAAEADTARSTPASSAHAWPDTYTARLEALALLQTLNAELLSHDSATQILGQWCADHRLAAVPKIVAQRVHLPAPAAGEQLRRDLRVAPGDALRFRHVRLLCGSMVLSEADNWYVPGRLSAAMNAQLESSEVPFGVVVRELQFQRHTLAARLLWEPLAGNAGGNGTLQVPERVLEHRALLALPDGTPISEVIETYTGNVLAFPPPESATRR